MRPEYVLKLLENGERTDGRKLDVFRDIKVETGIIKRAEGSARVKIGKTDVIVGIKTEIGEPFSDMPDMGILKTGAEFTPIASPDFESGPPREDAIELARVVDRGIRESECIDLEKLCIKEGEKAWEIFVDVHIINHDGNLIDASALAAVAALRNTKMPKLEKDKIIKDKLDRIIKGSIQCVKAYFTNRCKDMLPPPGLHYQLALFHRDNNPPTSPLNQVVACFILQFLFGKGDCFYLLFLFGRLFGRFDLISKINICNLIA